MRTVTKDNSYKTNIMITVFSFMLMAICSKSSFLYPLNDWVDANCYFSVGKAVVNSVALYKDIFWHGGPLSLIPYMIGYCISRTSFLGVYLMESVFCALSGFIIMKLYELMETGNELPLSFITSALIYSSEAFKSGGCMEEFMLPVFVFVLYMGALVIIKEKELSKRDYFVVGVLAGVVFWVKYTLCIFFVGWYIIFLVGFLKRKNYKALISSLIYIAAGVMLISVIVCTVFLIKGTLPDMIEQYFLYNMTVYGSSEKETCVQWFVGKAMLLSMVILNQLYIYALLIMAYIRMKPSDLKKYVLCVFGVQFFVELLLGRWEYYFLPTNIMVIFAVSSIVCQLERKHKLHAMVIAVFCLMFSYLLTPNKDFMKYELEQLPQYEFASVIKEEEDNTLISFGYMDYGVFTVSGIVPGVKHYICTNNNEISLEKQVEYVKQGVTNFIITTDWELRTPNYEKVKELFYEEGEREGVTLRLYKRIP